MAVINLTVRVLGGDGAATSGAVVDLHDRTRLVCTQQGEARRSGCLPEQLRTLQISHRGHVIERVRFFGDCRRDPYDNALVTREVVDINDATMALNLEVRLGLCDTSPVVEIRRAELDRLGRARGDPGGILLFDVPRFPGRKAYRFQWNNADFEMLVSNPLIPEQPGGPGWSRFSTYPQPVGVDLAALGRFFWLELPAGGGTGGFTIAVWSPNLSAATPLPALDFVVFYSPTTESYSAQYPYGLLPADTPDQQYMSLGTKYLVQDYRFAQKLLGRRNRCILVMPICRRGSWGPFISSSGLWAALTEVSIFLHRQCRTSSLGVLPLDLDPGKLAGSNLRSRAGAVQARNFGQVPRIGRLAVAGFSTGIGPVKALMKDAAGVQWRNAWRELWDLDGFHSGTGGWGKYLDILKAWVDEDPSRSFRLYHSSGRSPPDPNTHPHPLMQSVRTNARVHRKKELAPDVWAEEFEGDRFTVVRMADDYVSGVFNDAHHSVPPVGFSHAVEVTGVGRP